MGRITARWLTEPRRVPVTSISEPGSHSKPRETLGKCHPCSADAHPAGHFNFRAGALVWWAPASSSPGPLSFCFHWVSSLKWGLLAALPITLSTTQQTRNSRSPICGARGAAGGTGNLCRGVRTCSTTGHLPSVQLGRVTQLKAQHLFRKQSPRHLQAPQDLRKDVFSNCVWGPSDAGLWA